MHIEYRQEINKTRQKMDGNLIEMDRNWMENDQKMEREIERR